MRDLISRGIKHLSGVKDSAFIGALEGLRAWSQANADDLRQRGWFGRSGILGNLGEILSSAEIAARQGVFNRHELARGGFQEAGRHFELERIFTNTAFAAGAMAERRFGTDDATVMRETERLVNRITELWKPDVMADARLQRELLRTTGHRRATVRDVLGRGMLTDKTERRLERLIEKDESWLNAVIDQNLWIDERGRFADLRDVDEFFTGFIRSVEDDFGLPIVGFNPLRMFHVSTMLHARNRNRPYTYLLPREMMQPVVTGDARPFGHDAILIGNKLYSLEPEHEFELIEEGFYLVSSQEKLVADSLRKMVGKQLNTADGRGVAASVYKALHLGQQDVPLDTFDPFMPTTWLGAVFKPFLGHNARFNPLKMEGELKSLKTVYAQGQEWVLMRQFKPYEKSKNLSEFLAQFTAGRQNMDKVTTGTLFLYQYFDRLNSGLNSLGFGLPTQDLGSAGAIFTNLLKYRIAPVIGGVYAWRYLNYEAENIFGEGNSPEEILADAYVGMSIDLAYARDALGITDWAKHKAHLFPGSHFITELPVVGQFLRWDRSGEETEEYWKHGEDPIRRGRYWSLGNTPWIGGKVDRYEPNWYRKLKSDWEYTDTLYGSEDEYWANAPVPTPRYLLAPIRHFFTDPYHYELKHYYDRPYPLTGGIPELEEFPLIGPGLNATIGQIFKPTRRMHTDVTDTGPDWEGYAADMAALGYTPVSVSGNFGGTVIASEEGEEPESGAPLVQIPSGGFAVPVKGFYGKGRYVPLPAFASTTSATDRAAREQAVAYAAYVTASGNVEVMQYDPNTVSYFSVLNSLSEQSAQRSGMRVARAIVPLPEPVTEKVMESPLQWAGGEIFYNVTEMAGFYGFSLNTVLGQSGTGPETPRLADAGQILSYNRAWWDLDMGGFGGNLSEIGRRFLPKEDHTKDINPIPNTMPNWLPGPEYFVDFQHGDPYAKIKHGEIRLPGEAYEAIYEVPEVEKLMQIPEIAAMVENRIISRGDLYGPVTRFRILADVAPYSEQFRQLNAQIGQFPLSEEERREIQEIRKQLRARKDNLQLTPYRFKYADVATRQVTVKRIIEDPHAGFMFVTEEYPHNPIKLAGLRVPMGQDDPISQEARAYLRQVLAPGRRVTIQVDADPLRMVSSDTYDSIRAVVISGRRNVNRYLIGQGLVVEDEDDYSAPAVYARFTPTEIAVGRIWEEFAHRDSPFHTKYLQVRSALESYERRDLYSKSYQEWTEPIGDYLIPTFQSFIRHNPLVATGLGVLLGAQFGHTPFGRLVGAVIGGASVGLGALYRAGYEASTGEVWIPGRRQREREVEEYFDMLKYVKYMRLYAEASEEARQYGFNVQEYLRAEKAAGERRAERKRFLEEGKKQIMLDPSQAVRVARELRIPGPRDAQSIVKAINQEIKQLANARDLDRIPEPAVRAIMYYREAQRTMYAYEPGDPFQDLMAALPRRDRDYLPAFIKAPEEERERILEIVPDYLRRPLQAAWGMEVDEQPSLIEYFAKHGLPDQTWAGWRPDVSLEAVKIKFINHEGLDRSEFNVYPDDVKAAMQDPTPIPVMNRRRSIQEVKTRLQALLHDANIEDLEIDVIPTKGDGINVNVDLRRDRRKEIEQYMQENYYDIFMGDS